MRWLRDWLMTSRVKKSFMSWWRRLSLLNVKLIKHNVSYLMLNLLFFVHLCHKLLWRQNCSLAQLFQIVSFEVNFFLLQNLNFLLIFVIFFKYYLRSLLSIIIVKSFSPVVHVWILQIYMFECFFYASALNYGIKFHFVGLNIWSYIVHYFNVFKKSDAKFRESEHNLDFFWREN